MTKQQILFRPNGCRVNICNSSKLVKNLEHLIRYFKRTKPGFTLTLFGTSEYLINDLSGSGVNVTRDDIIHLFRGNNQDTWVNLPQNIKNKANFVNTKIPNVGNKRKKGCAGLYNKGRLLGTIPIPIGTLGIHKLAIVRSSLIPELYRANYGSLSIYGNIIRFKWAINCLNYKLPIFDWEQDIIDWFNQAGKDIKRFFEDLWNCNGRLCQGRGD